MDLCAAAAGDAGAGVTTALRKTMDVNDRLVLVARRFTDFDRPDPAAAVAWACAVPAMQDPTGRFLSALLLTTAYRHGDYLSDRLREVCGLDRLRERHGLTLDHGLCCDHDCACVASTVCVGERCEACEAAPTEAVDAAVRSVLLLVERAVSERAVADLAALSALAAA